MRSTNDDNVYALNAATGALLWSHATANYVGSSPAVANGVVYIGSNDGDVYALDTSTGAFLWSYPTGDNVESSVTVSNGAVYVGSFNGNVYAFGLPSGDETKQDAASQRPNPKTLRPDFNLKMSKPVTTPSDVER